MKHDLHAAEIGTVRRAALYLRVSTDEQSTAMQRVALEQLAAARRFDVVQIYEEQGSAAKHRAEFDRMMRHAHAGAFRVLLIWALDRFGRSTVGNQVAVLELDRLGVDVVSVQEPWLDMTGPVRSLLIAVFSWVAEQERVRIVARTREGLAIARKKGIRLGRPRKRVDVARAEVLRAQGWSLRAAARELGTSTTSLARALRKQAGH